MAMVPATERDVLREILRRKLGLATKLGKLGKQGR